MTNKNTKRDKTIGENTASKNTTGESTAIESTAEENTALEKSAGENTALETTAIKSVSTNVESYELQKIRRLEEEIVQLKEQLVKQEKYRQMMIDTLDVVDAACAVGLSLSQEKSNSPKTNDENTGTFDINKNITG